MPTEAAFRAAADAFDAAARDADDLMTPAHRALTPEVLSGGVLAAQVQRALDEAGTSATAVATECRDLAAECRRRAEECKQYWIQVHDWEQRQSIYNRQLTVWTGKRDAWANDHTQPDPGPRPTGPGSHPTKPNTYIE